MFHPLERALKHPSSPEDNLPEEVAIKRKCSKTSTPYKTKYRALKEDYKRKSLQATDYKEQWILADQHVQKLDIELSTIKKELNAIPALMAENQELSTSVTQLRSELTSAHLCMQIKDLIKKETDEELARMQSTIVDSSRNISDLVSKHAQQISAFQDQINELSTDLAEEQEKVIRLSEEIKYLKRNSFFFDTPSSTLEFDEFPETILYTRTPPLLLSSSTPKEEPEKEIKTIEPLCMPTPVHHNLPPMEEFIPVPDIAQSRDSDPTDVLIDASVKTLNRMKFRYYKT